MKKNPFVRWQLWMLGAVTILLLYRVMAGPPPREGLVVLENISDRSVAYRAFEVDRAVTLSVNGIGSFASLETSDFGLAAYAWLINSDTKELVWKMDHENTSRDQGTLAKVEDTIKLDKGHYLLYFASEGNHIRGRQNKSERKNTNWEMDNDEWHIVMDLVEGKETDVRGRDIDAKEAPTFINERLVWASGPPGNDETKEFLFKLEQPMVLKIRATGELADDQHDFGFIENEVTRQRVWEMKAEESLPAGGVEANRYVYDEIALESGVYRAAFITDATHAYGQWRGNPPYYPAGWGMVLTTEDTQGPVEAYDPWNSDGSTSEPVLSLMPFGDSEYRSITFRVTGKERYVMYGMGEMSHSDRYDFGWLERAGNDRSAYRESQNNDRFPQREKAVWEMNFKNSTLAGGDDGNRQNLAFVELVPDVYTLHYRTDGSHSFDEWSNGEPEHSDRWGIAMFALGKEGQSNIEVLDRHDFIAEQLREIEEAVEREHEFNIKVDVKVEAPPVPAFPAKPSTLSFNPENVLVTMNKMGNDATANAQFALGRQTTVHVIAVGEITQRGNQYDYGYIKNDSGEIVWEMTLENTVPAGGDETNRLFDGVLDLPAGAYSVFFQTDGTHAYGDFNTAPPALAEAWGITIAKAQ